MKKTAPIVLEYECVSCGRFIIAAQRKRLADGTVRLTPTKHPHSFPFDCVSLEYECDRCQNKRAGSVVIM